MPIITTFIDSLNVTAELDEFKNDVGLLLVGQQPPYALQAMTLGQRYHLLKYHFVPSRDYTFYDAIIASYKVSMNKKEITLKEYIIVRSPINKI